MVGFIPDYAAGILCRTGPGGYQVQTESGGVFSISHWFDGFSQVHRFQIIASDPKEPSSSPRVLYNSRRIVDRLVEDIRVSGRLDGFTFGQKRDVCEGFFRKAISVFRTSETQGNDNVGVTISINHPGLIEPEERRIGGIRALFTTTDASIYAQLDHDTLEPIGTVHQVHLHPDASGRLSAAHACIDPETGDVYNYNLSFGAGGSVYRIFRCSGSTGNTDIIATITDAPGTYIHSFSITQNYVILTSWSGHYAWGGMKILWEKNILDAIQDFDASVPARWYVIDRNGGNGVVATYESDTFFCFHTVNSWEEPSPDASSKTDVVIDLCAYENLDVIKRFYYDNIKSTSPNALEWTLDKRPSTRANFKRFRLTNVPGVSSNQTRTAHLDFTTPKEKSGDLPTINPRFKMKPSRYIYAMTDRGYSTLFDGLVKYDTETHEAHYWFVQGHSPGEAIFVPKPDGTDEDDGVVLSVVLNGIQSNSYLLVLDAKTMEEMGRAEMSCVVGFGFHGTHCGIIT